MPVGSFTAAHVGVTKSKRLRSFLQWCTVSGADMFWFQVWFHSKSKVNFKGNQKIKYITSISSLFSFIISSPSIFPASPFCVLFLVYNLSFILPSIHFLPLLFFPCFSVHLLSFLICSLCFLSLYTWYERLFETSTLNIFHCKKRLDLYLIWMFLGWGSDTFTRSWKDLSFSDLFFHVNLRLIQVEREGLRSAGGSIGLRKWLTFDPG